MRRRDFIAAIGATAASNTAWPLAAGAQQRALDQIRIRHHLQTARTLGIEVPPQLLAITDAVIE